MLSSYVDENGYIVEKSSTSVTCSWNKGKKREKTLKQLHNIEYKSSKWQKPDDLDYWDPRPKEFQIKNHVEQVNSFICNLQRINNVNRGNKLSMWQTLFKIKHKDFSLMGKILIITDHKWQSLKIVLNEIFLNFCKIKFQGKCQEQKNKMNNQYGSSSVCFKLLHQGAKLLLP